MYYNFRDFYSASVHHGCVCVRFCSHSTWMRVFVHGGHLFKRSIYCCNGWAPHNDNIQLFERISISGKHKTDQSKLILYDQTSYLVLMHICSEKYQLDMTSTCDVGRQKELWCFLFVSSQSYWNVNEILKINSRLYSLAS